MTVMETYRCLADALKKRLEVIQDAKLRETNPSLQLEQLKAVSEEISRLQKELPQDCDPHLKHYLQNCSFDKALAFLGKTYDL